jgi:hypothetical protein
MCKGRLVRRVLRGEALPQLAGIAMRLVMCEVARERHHQVKSRWLRRPNAVQRLGTR